VDAAFLVAFWVRVARWRFSSEDFLERRLAVGAEVFSTEFDLDAGLLYRLDVDFDFVSPSGVLPPDFDLTVPFSNSFLVSLTVSLAGSSFFLTPNSKPAEGRFWRWDPVGPEDNFGPKDEAGNFGPVEVDNFGPVEGNFGPVDEVDNFGLYFGTDSFGVGLGTSLTGFSSSTMSLTKAGVELRTVFILDTGPFSTLGREGLLRPGLERGALLGRLAGLGGGALLGKVGVFNGGDLLGKLGVLIGADLLGRLGGVLIGGGSGFSLGGKGGGLSDGGASLAAKNESGSTSSLFNRGLSVRMDNTSTD